MLTAHKVYLLVYKIQLWKTKAEKLPQIHIFHPSNQHAIARLFTVSFNQGLHLLTEGCFKDTTWVVWNWSTIATSQAENNFEYF